MGLRDWVSEKAGVEQVSIVDFWSSFNGAPRLGLGEGAEKAAAEKAAAELQWGSETGSRRRRERVATPAPRRRASMGLRDWVSEKGSRKKRRVGEEDRASMGLRDWVSEKVRIAPARTSTAPWLQWGSETGSRRRTLSLLWELLLNKASMGLRDWVSEKGHGGAPLWFRRRRGGFNGAPRLGLGEGFEVRAGVLSGGLLQWGSETGSRRRGDFGGGEDVGHWLQWGSETGSRRWGPRWEVHGEAFLEEVCERFKF